MEVESTGVNLGSMATVVGSGAARNSSLVHVVLPLGLVHATPLLIIVSSTPRSLSPLS
jgi:hypothetical protein